MKYKFLFLPVILFLFLNCGVNRQTAKNHNMDLPNMVQISADLFCDRTEVSNIDWREYVHWNKRIFGLNSREYLESFPDTLVWLGIDSSLVDLVTKYYRAKEYDEYPVVGISQNQAKQYSKWRSDRVFEMILIKYYGYKVIKNQNRENYFSIDRFLENSLDSFPYTKEVMYIPDFHLPDISERKLILNYLYDNNKSNSENIHYSGLDSKKIEKYGMVIRKSISKSKSKKIVDLQGNVSEWSEIDSLSFGGSWINTIEEITTKDEYYQSLPSAWTGFRNVGKWIKVN